jgi:hypothetical protein
MNPRRAIRSGQQEAFTNGNEGRPVMRIVVIGGTGLIGSKVVQG